MLALGLQRRPLGLQSLWPHQSTAVRLCACNAPVSVRANTLKFTVQGSIAAAAQGPQAHPATHPRATRKWRQRPRAEVPTPTSGMWVSSCSALRVPPALGLLDSEFRVLLGSAFRLTTHLSAPLMEIRGGRWSTCGLALSFYLVSVHLKQLSKSSILVGSSLGSAGLRKEN